MFRHVYKSKFWEGLPDNEKRLLKKWSKTAHVCNSNLLREVKITKKSAKRLLFSLDILDKNITCIQHEFNNYVNHLKNYFHFGASGKLTENYRSIGCVIKRKLTVIMGLLYTIPLVSSKQLKLKSDRLTIKYYRDFYTLLQFSDIELENQMNPKRCEMLSSKLSKIITEISLKFKNSQDRIKTLKSFIKNSP